MEDGQLVDLVVCIVLNDERFVLCSRCLRLKHMQCKMECYRVSIFHRIIKHQQHVCTVFLQRILESVNFPY